MQLHAAIGTLAKSTRSADSAACNIIIAPGSLYLLLRPRSDCRSQSRDSSVCSPPVLSQTAATINAPVRLGGALLKAKFSGVACFGHYSTVASWSDFGQPSEGALYHRLGIALSLIERDCCPTEKLQSGIHILRCSLQRIRALSKTPVLLVHCSLQT